jgi:isohexenylglutaconyl-CoA hydratase
MSEVMIDFPETKRILLERDQDWLTIWLNRPESRNALSNGMIEELIQVLEVVRGEASIRGITIRGNGGVFCAGGDIKGFKAVFQGEAGDEASVAAANSRAGELFELIDTMPQVVVMLAEGAAIAGGLGMLCAADIVVVTQDTKFALTETALGIPPAQIAPFVVRRIGLPAARSIMLTAARFTGEKAGDLGIANVVVATADELAAEEDQIRRQVRTCAPGANAATKEILLAAQHLERGEMRRFAAERFARCMLSDEGHEGVAAFIEKRKPYWTK